MLHAVHPLHQGSNKDNAIIEGDGDKDNDSDEMEEETEIMLVDESHTPTP